MPVTQVARRAVRLRGEVATPPRSTPPTRDVILDIAERLFAEHGLDGVAVRDIARETGLTPSSLYNHFPGKQALYDAVLDRGLRPVVEMTAAAWQAGPLDPERMRVSLDRLVAHLAAHPHMAPLLQRVLLADDGKADSRIAGWVRSLSREGKKLIGDTAGAAGWNPEAVPYLTLGVFGLTYSYFVNARAAHAIEPWCGDPFADPALALQREFLTEALLRLLGPRPRTARSEHPRRKDRR